jgi:hypothetical protein
MKPHAVVQKKYLNSLLNKESCMGLSLQIISQLMLQKTNNNQ